MTWLHLTVLVAQKIRGDYGATFRTGCTIIVTLDTDAGTLSFSTWKDSNSSSDSFSIDPSLQSGPSPRRTAGGGTIEDWGIAFEGLPLDSRLYPAVGLYQRDDRVTLLNVETGPGGREGVIDGKFVGGRCYYPGIPHSLTDSKPDISRVARVKRHNDVLSWDGIRYVTDFLRSLSECIGALDGEQNDLLFQVLPSVAAALSLLPSSIPMLSQRFGVMLLSHLSRCIQELRSLNAQQELFETGLREGKWAIRATGSSGSDGEWEEYIVDFTKTTEPNGGTIGFHGTGVGTTGKSKNGLVSIVGTTNGSAVHFVEDWSDENGETTSPEASSSSSCVITARKNFDGSRFEGSYRNVQYGSFGQISGIFVGSSLEGKSEHAPKLEDVATKCEALLCLAHGHLASILTEGISGDQTCRADAYRPAELSEEQWQQQCSALKEWVSSPLLARGLIDDDRQVVAQALSELQQLYTSPVASASSELMDHGVLDFDVDAKAVSTNDQSSRNNLESSIDKIDDLLTSQTGGKGSLSVLSPLEYSESRKKIIRALAYHCGLYEAVVGLSTNSESRNAIQEDVLILWSTSLKIIEDSIRSALSTSRDLGQSRKELIASTCENLDRTSSFLMTVIADIEPNGSFASKANDITSFYATVRSVDDISYIQAEMACSTKRALLRMSAMKEIALVLTKVQNADTFVGVECTISILPRLMGRAFAKLRQGRDDLGGHYLAQLAGASNYPTNELRTAVANVYSSLGGFLVKNVGNREMPALTTSSLVQCILAAFVVSIRAADVTSIVAKTGIFQRLSTILRSTRESVRMLHVDLETDNTRLSAIRRIQDIAKRDRSQSILKSATSIVHVLCFQLSQLANEPSIRCDTNESLNECLDLAIGEICGLASLIATTSLDSSSEYAELLASDEWKSWCGTCLAGGYRSIPANHGESAHVPFKAGIEYLNEHCDGNSTIGSRPNSLNDASNTENKAAAISDRSSEMLTLCCKDYITQWLHILACISKSPSALRVVAENQQLTDMLLTAVGLSCFRDSEGVLTVTPTDNVNAVLPARHRARFLRLLRDLVVMTVPNESLVESLFSLCGVVSAMKGSGDSDSGFLVREMVSLLRYLHLPSFMSWRKTVLRVISRNSDKSNIALGIRLFLGGSMNALGTGAYVILKPPAALPLSPEAHTSPSSKTHSSPGGSGSPSGGISLHHVAGNGTEGIVSGLCRADAAAGIVSSVLVKNGACEVVLMNRSGLPLSVEGGNDSSKRRDGTVSSSSRRSLTVRALRTPLSDVALAEEVPLFLDPSLNVEDLLGDSLTSALDALTYDPSSSSSEGSSESISPSETESADMVATESNAALASLRTAIAITSSKDSLGEFLNKTNLPVKPFARALAVAGSTNSDTNIDAKVKLSLQSESIAEIPKREANYAHLTTMLREINARRDVLDTVPNSFWEKHLEEQRMARATGSSDSGAETTVDSGGTRTPRTRTAPEDASSSSARVSQRSLGDEGGRRGESARMVSQSTVSTNNSTDEDDDGEAATHLREAAIAQMAELGLPRSWSELALRRTGGTIEAAVHFCLERGGDMERLIAEEQERERMQRQSSGGSSSRRRSSRGDNTSHLLSQLLEMGFPRRWCAEALAATGNNVDEALTWILTNGERLSAEDLGMEEDVDNDIDDDDDDDESAEDDEEADDRRAALETGPNETDERSASAGEEQVESGPTASSATSATDAPVAKESSWSGSVCPLRFISGRSIINSKTLSVSGLPSGGFSSVGTKGILLTSGKWYYEAILETAGCLQIGWADGSFSGHCNADRGDGCGDGPSSWAFDGWRRYRWHASATEWGCRWSEGDVVGCLVDLDEHIVSFTLNGQAEEIGMGVAFSGNGFRPCGGVYACVSFNRREKLRLILGGETSEPFKYQPPPGYKGVGEAVLSAVHERNELVSLESILRLPSENEPGSDKAEGKRYLCDFSDGEHGHELFAWQHRYYGSDASVHLGSARHSRNSSESQKTDSDAYFSSEASALSSITRRIEKEWKKEGELGIKDDSSLDVSECVSRMKKGYDGVIRNLNNDLWTESVALATLYCRKLILHLMVTLGDKFDLRFFLPRDSKSGNDQGELEVSRYLWSILDSCVSLRSAGWVGEAGAMAVAAEALGLGISSAHSRHTSPDARSAALSMGYPDDSVALPSAGIAQVLSAVLSSTDNENATSASLAACSEAALGTIGSLVFLRSSMQSLVATSLLFQDLLVAVVRRSVRLLAVVDYSGEDSENSEVRVFLALLTLFFCGEHVLSTLRCLMRRTTKWKKLRLPSRVHRESEVNDQMTSFPSRSSQMLA